MKVPFRTRFAVPFALTLTICQGMSIAAGQSYLELSLAQKQSVEYKLTRFVNEGREVKLPGNPALTLTIVAPGRVAGFAGVNSYFGSFRIGSQDRIYWQGPGFGSTLKAGPQELMDLEQLFFGAIQRTTHLRADNSGLRFETRDGAVRLEFVERAKADAIAELKNTKLVLARMVVNSSEIPLSADSPISMTLGDDGILFGAAPINSYRGGYLLSADGKFGLNEPLATTRMAGPPELMTLENAFLEALGQLHVLEPSEGGAALVNSDKSVLLDFLRQ